MCLLRAASYYKRFVEGLADKAAPLNDLLSQGAPFEWGHRQRASLGALKDELCVTSVPSYPVADETFTVTTDASDLGLGAVLEHGERVLGYKSRAPTPCEKNYSIIEKECLALI